MLHKATCVRCRLRITGTVLCPECRSDKEIDDLSDLDPAEVQAENDRIRRGEDDLSELRPLTVEEVACAVVLIRRVMETAGDDAPFGRVWGTLAREAYKQ